MESILRFGNTRVLFDPQRIEDPAAEWFNGDWWKARDAISARFGGRGCALGIDTPAGPAVLRHYHRGGMVRQLSRNRYIYTGLERTRAFREWRVTRTLFDAGLPVPEPLAAAVTRHGLSYTAALLTRRIENSQPLHHVAEILGRSDWKSLGRTLADFATAGLAHPDLNAANILVDRQKRFWLLDFDRARIAPAPVDPAAMLARLQRSATRLDMAFDHDTIKQGITG